MEVDLEIFNKAYGWTVSEDGELFALTSGDMGYESTGIRFEGETLEIWKAGVKISDQQGQTSSDNVLASEIGPSKVDLVEHQTIENSIIKALKKIPQPPQRQDSTNDQLKDLRVVAQHLGMYDAADFIRDFLS